MSVFNENHSIRPIRFGNFSKRQMVTKSAIAYICFILN